MYNSVKIIKTVACCKFGDPCAYFIKSFFFLEKGHHWDFEGTTPKLYCVVD